MRKFIISIIKFSFFLIAISLVFLLLPQTPRQASSPISAKIEKDSLLRSISKPRIVFIGGSNLAYGIDGEMIKDSLNLYPINTGIMYAIGLKAMLNNYLQHAKKGDIVIVSPEYDHFFGDFYNGNQSVLYYSGVDNPVNPLAELDWEQIRKVVPFFPKYVFRKVDIREYFGFSIDSLFNRNSFDQYGFLQGHWGFRSKPFKSDSELTEPFNPEVIESLSQFQKQLESRSCKLFISPPAYNASSASNRLEQIKRVTEELEKANIPVLDKFENYIFADTLFYNSPYHLNEIGAKRRTVMIINSIKAQPHNIIY